jgi:hypothetical protein
MSKIKQFLQNRKNKYQKQKRALLIIRLEETKLNAQDQPR